MLRYVFRIVSRISHFASLVCAVGRIGAHRELPRMVRTGRFHSSLSPSGLILVDANFTATQLLFTPYSPEFEGERGRETALGPCIADFIYTLLFLFLHLPFLPALAALHPLVLLLLLHLICFFRLLPCLCMDHPCFSSNHNWLLNRL